jgi:aspartate aminotransferase
MALDGPPLAARLEALPASATIAITGKARALRAAGVDVLSLSIGEPDFAMPEHALEAAHRAAREGLTKYPPIDGYPALRAAIARKFERDNGLRFDAGQIAIGHGGKQLLYNAFAATLEPGDEVVIPAPYWVSYALTAQLFGATVVPVDCAEAEDFALRPEGLAAAITPRTRWVVLNSPSNPSGAVFSPDLLRAIGQVLEAHPHVWVLSDEIYEHLVFAPAEHASIAALCPGLRDRVLTLNGVSKAYAMTGWRVGFAGGPARLVRAMAKMQGHTTSGVSGPAQMAAAAALDGPQQRVGEMRAVYRARRDRVVTALRAMQGITCAMPQGAFYAFPSIAGCLGRRSAGGRLLDSDTAFAEALLDEAHMAVVPGVAFGASPYLRLSTAAADEVLDEACARMARFCAELN